MTPNFSICLIVRNESKTIERCLQSLDFFVASGGDVCILDTGSTDNTMELINKYSVSLRQESGYTSTIDSNLANAINGLFCISNDKEIVSPGDRYFNFSAARNACARLAKNDWICYIDADEVLTKLDIEKINSVISNPSIAHIEYEFVFAHNPDGSPGLVFRQSKFYHRKKMQWVNITHEVLQPIEGYGGVIYLNSDILLLEHWQIPGDRHSYLTGLAVDCHNNPNNDRNVHYLARELMWSQRFNSAIKLFDRHINMNGWIAERAQSAIYIGDCFGKLNRPEDQFLSYSKAIYIDSKRREAFIRLAYFFMHNKNYHAAIAYAEASLTIKLDGYYANNKSEYEDIPHAILYVSYGWIGDIEMAKHHLLIALKYKPNHHQYLNDTKFYFEYGAPEIDGWMSYPELMWLYETAKSKNRIVEIGSWKGRSTHALCSGNTGEVFAVDTWLGSMDPLDQTNSQAKSNDIYSEFCQNTRQFTNLRVIRKSSLDASMDFDDRSIDMVFIDAGHTYEEVQADISAWLPKVKVGGIICGHDYSDVWKGVKKAVNEKFQNCCTNDTIWWYVVDEDVIVTIPKVIYTFWIGENELPVALQKCIESQKINGYEHILIQEVPDNVPSYVLNCIENKEWVKAVDYLKLWFLYRYGGIVMDADVEVLPGKNFDLLLNEEMFIGKEYSFDDKIVLGNAVIGSRPGHAFLKRLMSEMDLLENRGFVYELGMDLVNKIGVEYQQMFKILDPDILYPYNHQTGVINVSDNTICFHHFFKSWSDTKNVLPSVSILIPQLGREDGLKRCLKSIDRLYYPKHLIEVLVIEGEDYVPVKVAYGLKNAVGEYICYAANDMEFESHCLYNAIIASREHQKGLVSFNEGIILQDEGNICTHFIIRRDLIDQIGGQIFNTRMYHCGVDNLLWAKCKKINQAMWCDNAIIKHYHFSNGIDLVYERGWSHHKEDREVLNHELGLL